jgi:acyl dehydratase
VASLVDGAADGICGAMPVLYAKDPVPELFWEDFCSGQTAEYGPLVVTAEDITAFAREFDPQPMHLDEEAARTTMLAGLAASGWHTCGLMMRMLTDGFLLRSAFMGGAGCDEIRWIVPVRPGDALRVRTRVVEVRESRMRADAGFVKFLFEVVNADETCVLTAVVHLVFGRRVPMTAR